MMQNSRYGKNTRTGISKDAELAALEHKKRQQAAAKDVKKRKSLSPEQRREILNQIFFEGEAYMPYVKQFYLLLALSALIASLGLVRNSAAVVIGAMLLSPLMTPILAFTASLVMGWPIRAGRTAIRLFLATLFVFGLAYLLPFVFRAPTNMVIPAEVLARTNPRMAELLIGLCAGIAAAYMLIHKETISVLPGVAISVALVPPLCAAGLLTFVKEYALAWQAFVLYATNLVAIILTAGIVLLFTGLKPNVKDLKLNLRVAAGMILITLFVALVAVPLSMRTFNDLRDRHDRQVAISVIEDWIGENNVEIINVEVENNLLQIFLRINLPLKSLYEQRRVSLRANLSPEMTIDALQQRLRAVLGKKVDITLKGSFAFWKSTCPKPEDCYF
jgi:uncharacterized hydrophobic protein (TIGR00271 family)